MTQLGHEPRHKRRRLWSCKCKDCHRLSRHAIRYKGDLRTSSAVLDTPMSASRWSSSFSRSCLRWYRCSQSSTIPASHASGIFQDLLWLGNKGKAASRLLVECKVGLPQDMFHLRNGAKQRLAAGAHRAVVNGPSAFCIIPMRLGKGHPSQKLARQPDVGSWHKAAAGGRAEHVRSARVFQTSTCSAIAKASSTSIPRYLTVLSILVWPRRSWTALRLPVRR
jgi:hypothetical protein